MSGNQQTASVGNLASLAEGQVLLPRFVLERDDGLYVDLSMLDSGREFVQFANRVFEAGSLFADLDYRIFLKLLYEPESDELLKSAVGTQERPEVRFARAIAPFPKFRRPIYRDVRIANDGSRAEYIFEPVVLDIEEQVPIYGEPDENGDTPITGYEKLSRTERAWPEPDEFVAAMWGRGIRFGLDMDGIRRAARSEKPTHLDVARARPPSKGADASIVEQTEALHRSDAPSLLPNGRMNLSHFRNRFPQVTAGTRLVQKTARVLGERGWDVRGAVLEPDLPKDFDIHTLAGPGTKVERCDEGEFLVATINGFLNIDAESSSFSVTEKIINKTGVSMRTTGDLTLTGAEFEEHGEVQEKREVQGLHMSFMADVFGRIVSTGGNVVLHSNLAGGSIRNPGGNTTVEGKVSRAVIDGRGGRVQLEFAEGSLIIGSRVQIARAINCEILAEAAEIGHCEGTAVAGRQVRIESCDACRHVESVITVLTPDAGWWDKEIEGLEQERQQQEARRTELGTEQANLSQQGPVAKYLAIQRKFKAGELKLSAEQETALKDMGAKLAPIVRRIAQLNADVAGINESLKDLEQQIREKRDEKMAALGACACHVGEVLGETKVRRLAVATQGFPLAALAAKELRLRLREHGAAADAIFSGHGGSIDWQMAQED